MRSLLPEEIGQLALWQAGPFVLCSFRFGLIEGPDFLNMKVLRKAFYFRCHGLKTLFELQSMHFVPASKTISHRLQTSLLIGQMLIEKVKQSRCDGAFLIHTLQCDVVSLGCLLSSLDACLQREHLP